MNITFERMNDLLDAVVDGNKPDDGTLDEWRDIALYHYNLAVKHAQDDISSEAEKYRLRIKTMAPEELDQSLREAGFKV